MNTNHNLHTFKILFIVKGILSLLFCLFPILYIVLGGVLFANESDDQGQFAGMIFIGIGLFILFLGLIFGILTLLAGKYLGEQKNYEFIFVMAIVNCLTGILGILLGIFTIVELTKPEVKRLFGKPVPQSGAVDPN